MGKEDGAVYKSISPILTVSIGAGTTTPATGGDETTTAFIEAVDRRLYRAKQEGRNRVVSTP